MPPERRDHRDRDPPPLAQLARGRARAWPRARRRGRRTSSAPRSPTARRSSEMPSSPSWIESVVVHTDSYESDHGEFAHSSAATVAPSSTTAPPVSVLRKPRTGAARFRAHAVFPLKGVPVTDIVGEEFGGYAAERGRCDDPGADDRSPIPRRDAGRSGVGQEHARRALGRTPGRRPPQPGIDVPRGRGRGLADRAGRSQRWSPPAS